MKRPFLRRTAAIFFVSEIPWFPGFLRFLRFLRFLSFLRFRDTGLPEEELPRLRNRGREGLHGFHRAHGEMSSLCAPEVIEVAPESFADQIGSGAVLALSYKISLLKHGWRQSDQDLFWHRLFPQLQISTKSQAPCEERDPVLKFLTNEIWLD